MAKLKAAALLLALAVSLPSAAAWADSELRDLYRGARATAMGGSFTAVADDEETLWYNPAGLAGIRRPELHYLEADLQTSTDLISSIATSASTFSNLSASTLNQLMGKNVFLQAQVTPTFVMPNFGLGLIADEQVGMLVQNPNLPQVNLDFQQTNGIKFGYGTSVNRKGRNSRDDIRVGIGGELLYRRGGYHTLSEAQLFSISRSELSAMTGAYQRGIGFDLGTQWIHRFSERWQVSLGAAYTAIGDIHFADTTADPQKGDLSTGLAARYRWRQAELLMSYDLRQLQIDTDFRKKSHLGVELALPFISLQVGLNQLQYTYGAFFDIWILRVGAVSYASEQDSYAGEMPERRYLLHVDFKLGL